MSEIDLFCLMNEAQIVRGDAKIYGNDESRHYKLSKLGYSLAFERCRYRFLSFILPLILLHFLFRVLLILPVNCVILEV